MSIAMPKAVSVVIAQGHEGEKTCPLTSGACLLVVHVSIKVHLNTPT
jgi:hypothetical protein